MLFLIAYYRFLGVIAAGALIVYAILLYAVVVLVPITLTLPGIAGIILTIGVASDANVVIFERVRGGGARRQVAARRDPLRLQEGHHGDHRRQRRHAGDRRDPVPVRHRRRQGLRLHAVRRRCCCRCSPRSSPRARPSTCWPRRGSCATTATWASGQREIRWKMDFVGKWKLWMAITIIPLVIGAVWIGIHGLNLGLDFESGTRITMQLRAPPSGAGRARPASRASAPATPRSRASTEKVNGRTTSDGLPDADRDAAAAPAAGAERALDQKFGVNEEHLPAGAVGPTFGAQIIRNAICAILLSFGVIILYLSIRFEYKLAIPALLSVIHDVWLSISIYSFTGREVTSATVAALLTILGYSLYDVVIVFDRIRENVPIMRRSTYREVVNTSVHETLTRIDDHQIITLIPHGALYFFGGDTLKDFAFALLVGHPLRRAVVDRHRRADRRALEGARTRAQAAHVEGRAPRAPASADDRLRRRRPRGPRARRGRPGPRAPRRGGLDSPRTTSSTRRRGARGRGAPQLESGEEEPEAEPEAERRARARVEPSPSPRPSSRRSRGARGRGGRRFRRPTARTAPGGSAPDHRPTAEVEPAERRRPPSRPAGAPGPEPGSDGTVRSRGRGRR